MVRQFDWFVAIDWSGAVGERHRSIAMAVAHAGGGPPVLVKRERGWSRGEVLDVLIDELPVNSMVGLDLGISFPYADRGAFFPNWERSPRDARSLWALVESICADDDHFAAASFVDHPEACQHFRRHGGREGEHFGTGGRKGGRGRFRVTEQVQEEIGCKPYSNFNLVGAAQVGKSSLTGMRVLNALQGKLPVWPVDPLPFQGSVVVEIYTALAALAAGRQPSKSKMRSYEALNDALTNLGSPPVAGSGSIDDHASDALLAAAWMRVAASSVALWSPAGLSREIAPTEGWTFGVP